MGKNTSMQNILLGYLMEKIRKLSKLIKKQEDKDKKEVKEYFLKK